MAALCVPETDSSSCANLCEECGKELETHCFVDSVTCNNAVPSFLCLKLNCNKLGVWWE